MTNPLETMMTTTAPDSAVYNAYRDSAQGVAENVARVADGLYAVATLGICVLAVVTFVWATTALLMRPTVAVKPRRYHQ